jgi:hypothetical protein
MLQQVQFLTFASQLNVPVSEGFRGFGGAFTWINLQLKIGLSDMADNCVFESDTDRDNADAADDDVARRLVGTDTPTEDEANAQATAAETSAANKYLAVLGMTAPEFMLGNFVGVVGFFTVVTCIHRVVEKAVVHYMKNVRKISDFAFPPGMAYPAFEIVAFLFLFPGLANSCIVALETECTPWPFKVFAALVLSGMLGLLGWLYSLIRTGDKLVPFSQTREGFNAAEDFKGYDRMFQFKNKHSEKPAGRYKRFFTALDRLGFGRWTPISAHGKYTAKIFQARGRPCYRHRRRRRSRRRRRRRRCAESAVLVFIRACHFRTYHM